MSHDEEPIGRRTALLVNTQARSASGIASSYAEALSRRGLELTGVVQVGRPDELIDAARQALKDGPDRLILGGGDGTISGVAPLLAGRRVALGIIPLGTANDFARTLNLPTRPEAVADVASGSTTRRVDLAQANEHWFLNAAHIGVAAEASREVTPNLKRWLGKFAYAVTGVRSLARSPTFRATIATDQETEAVESRALVIGNGRYFGGGVLVSAESTLDDGQLVVYELGSGPTGRWNLVRTLLLLRLRVPIAPPGRVYIRAARVEVSADPPQVLSLDGELKGRTPVVFRVVPGALRVLVPEASGADGQPG